MLRILAALFLMLQLACGTSWATGPEHHLKFRVSFGHRAKSGEVPSVCLLPGAPGVNVSPLVGVGLRANDRLGERSVLQVGGGHVAGVEASVSWIAPTQPARKPHETWAYLFEHSTPGSWCGSRRSRFYPGCPGAHRRNQRRRHAGLFHWPGTTCPAQGNVAAGARCFCHSGGCSVDFARHLASLKAPASARPREARTRDETRRFHRVLGGHGQSRWGGGGRGRAVGWARGDI